MQISCRVDITSGFSILLCPPECHSMHSTVSLLPFTSLRSQRRAAGGEQIHLGSTQTQSPNRGHTRMLKGYPLSLPCHIQHGVTTVTKAQESMPHIQLGRAQLGSLVQNLRHGISNFRTGTQTPISARSRLQLSATAIQLRTELIWRWAHRHTCSTSTSVSKEKREEEQQRIINRVHEIKITSTRLRGLL